jgi:hypothetical protein
MSALARTNDLWTWAKVYLSPNIIERQVDDVSRKFKDRVDKVDWSARRCALVQYP